VASIIIMARGMEIRQMQAADAAAVIALELECGLNARSEASLLSELENDLAIRLVAAAPAAAGISIGAVFGGRVVLDELQIDNLAVLPALRCQGIGARLLRAALETARKKGAIRAVLEVRANNAIAQNLYRKFGFEVVGTRRDYYQQPAEDARVMVCDLLQG
jgi:[ribosomal protein S18]-alanine N-acetyltransferase